ncbi:MAG TPA: hypothetical protein VNT81_17850 [Vicinamibacterales bacterium]|nr:hypothetical protein [Vicinamibacterales bacterium]
MRASLRPAARKAAIAGCAAHKSAQREVWSALQQRSSHGHFARQNRLGLIEDLFADQRIEVAALIANTKLRDVDDADIQSISQEHADRL